MQKDTDRTKYLEEKGLLVVRFTNLDVNNQFRQVCETVDMAVRDRYKGE